MNRQSGSGGHRGPAPKSISYVLLFFGLWTIDLAINVVNNGREALVPMIAFDNEIPFLPVFIYFYSLYFPLVVLPLIVFYRMPVELRKYVVANVIVMLVSYVIFLVFPTKLLRVSLSPSSPDQWLTLIYHQLVAPCNLLPSLHVSMLIIAFLSLCSVRKRLAWFLAPAIGLCIVSVVFSKQHYVLDVITAIPLALVAYGVSRGFRF